MASKDEPTSDEDEHFSSGPLFSLDLLLFDAVLTIFNM